MPNDETETDELTEEEAGHLWERLIVHVWYPMSYQERYSNGSIQIFKNSHFTLALVASLAAVGSPIAGLSLWETSYGKALWAGLSFVSALSAIILAKMNPERVKQETESRRGFLELRLTAEATIRGILAPPGRKPSYEALDLEAKELEKRRKELETTVDLYVLARPIRRVFKHDERVLEEVVAEGRRLGYYPPLENTE